MSPAPLQPVLFEPLFVPKPWGGRRLESLLGKSLPPGQRIGESWEVVSLPGHESHVRGGPLAGAELRYLVDAWGDALLGGAHRVDGRFPLLLKYLDAAEPLSVQVHPRPDAHAPGAVKHEAWVVLHADPGARLHIGVRPGATPAMVAAAAGGPRLVDLLVDRPVRTGDCFHLPSGTVHALGGGIVVAEVQTPSDVTYRLYDWGRVDGQSRPRPLHIDAALAHIRYDVREDEIVQAQLGDAGEKSGACEVLGLGEARACERLCQCAAFTIQRQHWPAGRATWEGQTRLHLWMMVAGDAVLSPAREGPRFDAVQIRTGDTLMIPAGVGAAVVEASAPVQLLDVSPR